MVRVSDGGGEIRINEYDYSTWDLATKVSWLAKGAGSGGTAEAAGALSNLGDSLTQADTNLRQAAAKAGIEWHGSAAEAAGTALTRAGLRSSDVGTAHTDGAMTVAEYGTSFGGMSAKVGSMTPPEYGYWDGVLDRLNPFDPMHDYKAFVEQTTQLNNEADVALKSHEATTREAWNQIPTLSAAAPTTTGAGVVDTGGGSRNGVAGAVGGGGGGGAGVVAAGAEVAGAPGGSGAPPAGGGGSASTAPSLPIGDDSRSSETGSSSAGGTPSSVPTLPGLTDTSGLSTVPGLTDAAGYTPPPTQLPSTQLPSTQLPSSQLPYAPTPPGSSYGSPMGTMPIGGSPFSPSTTNDVGALGGRRVSTGAEFGSRLLRAIPPAEGLGPGRGALVEPTAAAGRAGAAGSHGVSGGPMMGGGGGGGRNDSTRQAKYVIPSSAAFEPPLPPHVTGVLGPEDEDDYPY